MADLRTCRRCGEDNDCGDCLCDLMIGALIGLGTAIARFVFIRSVADLADKVTEEHFVAVDAATALGMLPHSDTRRPMVLQRLNAAYEAHREALSRLATLALGGGGM